VSYANINRVVLVGRLTKDPDLRALASGTMVCNLRIACDGFRKSLAGDYERKPNFFNVSVYGGQAENVGRYTAKGRRVAVDGRLDWHEWETAEGQHREAVEIFADRVEFLDGPSETDEGAGDEEAAAGERQGDLVF
jgi:single-strand DNA-binding protein